MKLCVEYETTRWSLDTNGGDGEGKIQRSGDRGADSGD